MYLPFLLLLFFSTSHAIKCKCTKESETVVCSEGGLCEMEGGSCLMLDHPTLGIHYTCHSRTLQNGSCRTKTSKSNNPVKICGCDDEDYCNYSYWPDGSEPAMKGTKTNSSFESFSVSSLLLFVSLFNLLF